MIIRTNNLQKIIKFLKLIFKPFKHQESIHGHIHSGGVCENAGKRIHIGRLHIPQRHVELAGFHRCSASVSCLCCLVCLVAFLMDDKILLKKINKSCKEQILSFF